MNYSQPLLTIRAALLSLGVLASVHGQSDDFEPTFEADFDIAPAAAFPMNAAKDAEVAGEESAEQSAGRLGENSSILTTESGITESLNADDMVEKWDVEHAGQVAIEEAADEYEEMHTGLVHSYSSAQAKQEFERRMRRAEVATVTRDFELAETIYKSILMELPLEAEQRRVAMLDLAKLCKSHRKYGKIVVVYEKFLEEFPRDPEVATISMDLGLIYRSMGAFDSALRKFYSVLNLSLLLPRERIDAYREISTRAQIEIAETHFLMGEYVEAARYFERLLRLELSPLERASVTFQFGYTHFLSEDFQSTISALRDFAAMFPGDEKIPESHYLLAEAYRNMNQMQSAMQEVLTLLRTNEVVGAQNPALWLFWKQKTGNQLANAFYERGDHLNALKIYQAMTPLTKSVTWQGPIIYQIGLCFERLRMAPKAIEAYAMLDTMDQWAEEVARMEKLPDDLAFVQEMARWRKQHLEWSLDKDSRLNDLFNNPILREPDAGATTSILGDPEAETAQSS